MICHGRAGRKPGGLPVIDHGSQSPDQDARASMPEACRADALPVFLDHGGRKAAGGGG